MDSFKDVLEAAQSYCKAQMAERRIISISTGWSYQL